MGENGSGPNGFETLRSLLAAASDLAGDLATDPFLARLLAAFGRFPGDDRKFVVDVLERESAAKRLADTTQAASGVTLRPNFGVRLYLRVFERDPSPESLATDPDIITLASVRAIRMVHRVIGPMYDRWHAAMRSALRSLAPEERAEVEWFNREMLTLVAEVDADAHESG
jgi:hypothetical protein